MPPSDWFHDAAQAWQNFYMLTGGAAATLAGLMFVAVTFGSSLVTKESASSSRAFLDPMYRHFVQVLLTACLLTVPTLTGPILGVVLIAMGAFRASGLYRLVARYREAHRRYGDIDTSDWITGVYAPLVVYAALVGCGGGLIAGHGAALTGLAVVVLLLLFLGVYGAWEILVWMALAVSERRPPQPPDAGVTGGTPL
jgi:hypothetical protein